jgi:hypothetical protein
MIAGERTAQAALAADNESRLAPISGAQSSLQAKADSSPQAHHMKQVQLMMRRSPQAQLIQAMSAKANAVKPAFQLKTSPVVQRLRIAATGQVVSASSLTEDEARTILLIESGDPEERKSVYQWEPRDIPAIRARLALPQRNEWAADDYEEWSDGDDEEMAEYVPDDESELIATVTTAGRDKARINQIRMKDGEEQELKPFGQKAAQGSIGETLAKRALQHLGEVVIDLNEFALNFSGVDHMTQNPARAFEQTKLHLAESTANVDTYLAHLKRSSAYAVKALKQLMRIRDLPARFTAFGLTGIAFFDQLLIDIAALKEEGAGDDIEDTPAHTAISESMVFSVPSDIYAQIPGPQRSRFVDLGWTVEALRGVMAELMEGFEEDDSDVVPAKPPRKKGEDEDDEDWGQ